jgi:putative methyltransferase (TIGR04325 family)
VGLLDKLKKNIRPDDITGSYHSWEGAREDSNGYDSPIILERTKAAMKKVVSGEAVYERDSVLFEKVEYSYPLLAGLMWVAAKYGGILHVLDFGGSLGTTYYQNYEFLRGLSSHQWGIVEQPEYVKAGKEIAENEYLTFYESTRDYLRENVPNVILCSSVLQYVENPYGLLFILFRIPSCKYLIIDRTPFWDGEEDWIGVQKVPRSIYPASYPIRIFSKKVFLLKLEELGYKIMVEFPSIDHLKSPINAEWKGMILVKEKI